MTDLSDNLYSTLIGSRRQGRTPEETADAAILDAADGVFSAILGANDADGASLAAAASGLRRMAASVQNHEEASPAPKEATATSILGHSVQLLAQTLRSGRVVSRDDVGDQPDRPRQNLSALLARFAVGREVITSALALALAMGIAFSTRYVIEGNHWYWVPLTVSIVVKPDLGSVFARAILRAAGTVIGVVIGTALLVLLPKGPVLVIAIAALAGTMSWAKQVSYAVQTLVLTPLMLVLLDLISPSALTVDYAGQRLVDTLLGGAIAIVVGYFPWPRSHGRQLATAFGQAMVALVDFLTAACSPNGGDAGQIGSKRRSAYALLSNLRATLQRGMSEPGAAGTEAAAWFPVVAGAERLCDRITAYAAERKPDDPLPPAEAVKAAADQMRSLGQTGVDHMGPNHNPPTDFISGIIAETGRLGRMLSGVTAPPVRQ